MDPYPATPFLSTGQISNFVAPDQGMWHTKELLELPVVAKVLINKKLKFSISDKYLFGWVNFYTSRFCDNKTLC